MTGRWRVVVLVALLGAPAAACSDDGPGAGEAHLEVDGEATVERADGDTEVVDDDTDLGSGDRVTVTEGTAVMRLQGGTTFELRTGIGGAEHTKVLMAERPVLEAGDLLVATPESAHVEADGTDVDVTEGAARITRAFGMSVTAYDADVALDSAGVAAGVPALRRMVVPDLGRPPRDPRPVEYDGQDPWDRRYLGAADALGRDLEVLAEQLTGFLPSNQGRTPGFFRLVLPGLEDEESLTQDLLDQIDPARNRDQGDTLIGAAISDLGERGTFEDRWDAVFTFRDEGAAWGIVALDQAVRSEPLVGSVEEAFNTSFEETAAATEPVSPSDPGGTGGTDGGTDGGGTTDGGGGSTDGTDGGGEPPPTEPPVTPPTLPPGSPEPPDELAPAVDPVIDLVEDLLGGLLG